MSASDFEQKYKLLRIKKLYDNYIDQKNSIDNCIGYTMVYPDALMINVKSLLSNKTVQRQLKVGVTKNIGGNDEINRKSI